MKKNHIIILSTILSLVIIVISAIVLKNYSNAEKKQIALYNDFNRAMIIYSISFFKSPEEYFQNIRHQQRYTIGNQVTRMSLIYNMKEYDFIDILNYLPENVEIPELNIGLDNFAQFLNHMNMFLNPEGPESCFERNDNGKKEVIKQNGRYIYKFTKEIVSKDTFKQLFSEYINSRRLNSTSYFYDLLWRDSLIKAYYGNNRLGYNRMKNDIKNNYENFYFRFENIVSNIISNVFNEFTQYLLDGLQISSGTRLVTKTNYSIKLKTETLTLNFELFKVQPLYNDITRHSTVLYGLDLNSIKEQMKALELPFIFS